MATSKLLLSLVVLATTASAQYVLTPPYFNIAENRPITANATCGEGGVGKESYCKLVGGFDRIDETWGMSKDIIDGQVIYVKMKLSELKLNQCAYGFCVCVGEKQNNILLTMKKLGPKVLNKFARNFSIISN